MAQKNRVHVLAAAAGAAVALIVGALTAPAGASTGAEPPPPPPPTAAPASEAAPRPPSTAYQVDWTQLKCVADPVNGGWRAIAAAKTWVNTLPDTRVYYQRVKITLHKYTAARGWRPLESRTYDWRVYLSRLPAFAVSSVRSVVGSSIANGGYIGASVQVKLMRVRTGPDATVWQYERWTPGYVSCDIFGG